MGRNTRANDWQFAGILSLGASVGLACGGWVFTFRSLCAACREDFVMLGAGGGTPGTTLEISLPNFYEGDLSWSPVQSNVPFSAEDLNGAPGVIGTIGGSLGVGYSRLYATAYGQGGADRSGCKTIAATVRPPGPLFPEKKSGASSMFTGAISGTKGFVGAAQTGKEPVNQFAARSATITAPKMTPVPEKKCTPENRFLFKDQLNDGYGVLADIESKRLAQAASDGLLETAGKAGKRFKPAISIGAMGVVGMWFSIGNVVTGAMAAAGYVAVSVLAGGLVQAGEALLSGRGLNVMMAFATGYATQLANMTSESPDMPDSRFASLKYCNWKEDLKTYGQLHVDGGSRAMVSDYPQIGFAGEAAVLQAVLAYVESHGEDAWYALKQKHRSFWGQSTQARMKIYEQALWRQVKAGRPVGFRAANDFMP